MSYGYNVHGNVVPSLETKYVNKDKHIAERMGIKPEYNPNHSCPHCGHYCTGSSVYCCPPIPIYPDFSSPAGTVMLLELMMGREDNGSFYHEVLKDHGGRIIYLITTPGALRDAVYEFLRGRDNEDAVEYRDDGLDAAASGPDNNWDH